MVNASAGSGKTRCLIAKIMYILESGTRPKNICAVTFTNKAAEEIKKRLKKYYEINNIQISTIHSMCVRIIKTFPRHTHLRVPFSIYDDSDQLSVIKTIIKSREFPEDPREVLSTISRAKSEATEHELEDNNRVIYEQYQEILKKNNACDFDDLLIYALQCLKQDDCRTYFSNLWKHIMVDEFQDTSVIQYNIIRALYNPGVTQTLFLVGDQNQSIYAFRAARPENMQDFIKTYNPSICYLTYNYRSCPEIIKHANNYLQFGKSMIAKSQVSGKVSMTRFNSREDEAEKIAQALLKMEDYENTAILYRVNSRSLLFEQAFSRYGIPYKVVGSLPFYQRKVIKDLVGYLRAATNPNDIESLARIVNVPKRGFGDTKKERLFLEGRSYVEKVAEDMPAIRSFLDLLNDVKHKSPYDAVQEVLYRTQYRSSLTKDSDLEMIDAFLDILPQFPSVDELVMAATFLERDTGKGVRLMTGHSSKGMEFDRVFVVGIEQGVWPHVMSSDFDEESRLFYVSITRAKKYLNISYSKSRIYRGQIMETEPSNLFTTMYGHLYGKDLL